MKKKRKDPLALRTIRWGLGKTEYFAPKWTHKQYINLFFSPMKSNYFPFEEEKIKEATTIDFNYQGKMVKCYKWGDGKRKVLFVHGWAGRAGQGVPFVDKFVSNDCTFYAIDLPAHGYSSSKQTNVIECAAVLKQVILEFGTMDLAIGHSFGGVVLTYALGQELDVNKLAMIGTPHKIEFILNEFQRNVGASDKAIEALKKFTSTKLNVSWTQIDPIENYGKFDSNRILLIHDEQDKEIPFHLAEEAQCFHPEIAFVKTQNLGHKRILKDDQVIQKCISFI